MEHKETKAEAMKCVAMQHAYKLRKKIMRAEPPANQIPLVRKKIFTAPRKKV
jgi:hypothetical protein